MSLKAPDILCHPDGEKSCGACCGMYNRAVHDRGSTLARLHTRTVAFRREVIGLDADELDGFRERWEEERSSKKLLDGLRNCPFLGLLDVERATDDPEESRVGCLVHPQQNGGDDARDHGVYDQHVCEAYLCAAHRLLREKEKWLVIEAVDDSYLYGLVITDVRFIRELFRLAADFNGAEPTEKYLTRPQAIEAARRYFELKQDWPFRAPDAIFGQRSAGKGLDAPLRPGPAEQLGVEAGRFETVLRCLGTQVESTADLAQARGLISERVEPFAAAVDIP